MKNAISRMLLDLDWPRPRGQRSYAAISISTTTCSWGGRPSKVVFPLPVFDKAIYGLIDALQPYEIVGWHCTRLTDAEADDILRDGMQLPDVAMLARRIDAVVKANKLAPDIARLLKSKNQADEEVPRRDGLVLLFPAKKGRRGGHRTVLPPLGR